MNKRLGVGVFLLGLASCASEPVALNVDYLNGKTNYPPQPVATVLQSAPSGTYTPIALLTASGAPGITQEQVIGALQQRAQALGANAIIVKNESETTPTDNVTYNPAGGQYAITDPAAEIKLSAIAIITPQDTVTAP
jgi:hypothetical protein